MLVLQSHGVALGEEAHIRSPKRGGPRHDPRYPPEQLDTYANLVLLCPTHHAVVDKDNGRAWSIDELLALKASHESRVDGADGRSHLEQQEDELLSARLELWEQRASLEGWQDFTYGLNDVFPHMSTDTQRSLFDLGTWLLSLTWPDRYPKIRDAFKNYEGVLAILLEHFVKAGDRVGERIGISRDYVNIPWDPPRYKELKRTFDLHCETAWWLTIELTRAVNLVISAIRSEFDPLYRFSEGMVLMAEGDMIVRNDVYRVEYENVDWREIPYRRSRDDVLESISAAMLTGGVVNLWEIEVPTKA